MSRYDEVDCQFVFEKDIDLYDNEEAGKTCQKIKINGKEINIHDFKRSKKPQEKVKGHSWLRKHGFIPD